MYFLNRKCVVSSARVFVPGLNILHSREKVDEINETYACTRLQECPFRVL